VFVEERSLRVLAVHLEKGGVNITCHALRDNVRTIELVTDNTTPHVHGKEILVDAFDSSM